MSKTVRLAAVFAAAYAATRWAQTAPAARQAHTRLSAAKTALRGRSTSATGPLGFTTAAAPTWRSRPAGRPCA